MIVGGLMILAAQILGSAGAVAGLWEDAKAKAELREVSQTMTSEELVQAREMDRTRK